MKDRLVAVRIDSVQVGELRLSLKTWECDSPSAPAMVLLPATGMTADDWDAVAENLSHDRLVYCPDLRGHGRSDWPGDYSLDAMATDVVGMLDMLGGAVDLVGHSTGGFVACLVASR